MSLAIEAPGKRCRKGLTKTALITDNIAHCKPQLNRPTPSTQTVLDFFEETITGISMCWVDFTDIRQTLNCDSV